MTSEALMGIENVFIYNQNYIILNTNDFIY